MSSSSAQLELDFEELPQRRFTGIGSRLPRPALLHRSQPPGRRPAAHAFVGTRLKAQERDVVVVRRYALVARRYHRPDPHTLAGRSRDLGGGASTGAAAHEWPVGD